MGRRSKRWTAVTIAALFLIVACSSFSRGTPVDQLPTPLPERDRVEVWSGGASRQLHAVSLDADTLRGVPWWMDPHCDSCRVAIPRAAVDSVRTLHYASGETGAFLLILAPIIAIALFVKGFSGQD